MVFYMDLYRKCDFLCKGCIEFYYDKRRQEMLSTGKIVSIEEYNATNKKSFKNGGKYLLCNGCARFFIFLKNKEMTGIEGIEKIR